VPAQKPLERFHSDADNTEVIVCRGRLRAEECDALEGLIDMAISRQVVRLRIELRSAIAIDEAVVRCLIKAAQRCSTGGVRLEIMANRRIQQTLALGKVY
jgi:anti-anti-sigma regulatory factor